MIKRYCTKIKDGLLYSVAGLLVVMKERAFQLELLVGLPAIAVALRSELLAAERALLVSSILLVWIAEAANTAIEKTVDRISVASHATSRQAKDVGSLVVFLSAVNAAIVWALVYLAAT